ncbi:uncharacterized protein LOC122304814 [Carya illinoinensis]|uniref:uncharacterized protein LOC122304814 n=1 Tax=Carya illinoinensis TaxID=32201 RepID=UPI001C71F2AF|nr:uncharacterized protein LOC122304814 [Carya illinoinensis]
MVEGKKEWNEDLIRPIFREEEANQICCIPLSRKEVEDKLIWGPSNKGLFSVKSAYFLEKERSSRGQGESSRGIEADDQWKHIWSMNLPSKMKLFIWKAGNNLLATKSNLVARKKWNTKEDDFLGLWAKISSKLNKSETEEVVAVMRNLWIRRNKFIFEQKFASPSCVIRLAKEDLNEYYATQSKPEGLNSTQVREKNGCPPEQNMVKANWDAAFDAKARKVGVGVIIRNERGEVMVACHEQKLNVADPVTAECYAFRKAMDLCRDLYFDKVIFEGDAQVIINAVNVQVEDLSYVGSLVEELRRSLKRCNEWRVQ